MEQKTVGNLRKCETAEEAYSYVEELANKNAVQEIRTIETMKPGQVVRQGDIYIHMVNDSHPRAEKREETQLAPGTTSGSRHIVTGDDVEVFNGSSNPEWASTAILGPVFCVKKGTRARVTHPEHAHVDLPSGTYQVTYQRDARTLDRVQD